MVSFCGPSLNACHVIFEFLCFTFSAHVSSRSHGVRRQHLLSYVNGAIFGLKRVRPGRLHLKHAFAREWCFLMVACMRASLRACLRVCCVCKGGMSMCVRGVCRRDVCVRDVCVVCAWCLRACAPVRPPHNLLQSICHILPCILPFILSTFQLSTQARSRSIERE